ncbi:hypothetical protein PoB_001079600 [Plakobranchus ocellatus]|uniref:Uncharacterized protein n=1 Tax=Plakobranchus ocellatus TaxID=259542 RepID=A0AAV3YAJ9_9GAST|nr:hypothetical protein PoB_001079600 [Plakobranchus ocellatus]
MFKGNKRNDLKGGNHKFSRGGDGVGFQPIFAHHYVFHVSMGDRGDGRPTDTTLLNTLAPVLVAHGLLTYGTTKLPSPAPSGPKIDTHGVHPGVIMGGTTLDPKHNVGNAHRQNVWTPAVLRALVTVGAQKPFPMQITLIGT